MKIIKKYNTQKNKIFITIFLFNNNYFSFFRYFFKLNNIKFKKNKNVLTFIISQDLELLKNIINFFLLIEETFKKSFKLPADFAEEDPDFEEDFKEQNFELNFAKVSKKYGIKYKATTPHSQQIFLKKKIKPFIFFSSKNFNLKTFNSFSKKKNLPLMSLLYQNIISSYISLQNILKLINFFIWYRKLFYLRILQNAYNTPN